MLLDLAAVRQAFVHEQGQPTKRKAHVETCTGAVLEDVDTAACCAGREVKTEWH